MKNNQYFVKIGAQLDKDSVDQVYKELKDRLDQEEKSALKVNTSSGRVRDNLRKDISKMNIITDANGIVKQVFGSIEVALKDETTRLMQVVLDRMEDGRYKLTKESEALNSRGYGPYRDNTKRILASQHYAPAAGEVKLLFDRFGSDVAQAFVNAISKEIPSIAQRVQDYFGDIVGSAAEATVDTSSVFNRIRDKNKAERAKEASLFKTLPSSLSVAKDKVVELSEEEQVSAFNEWISQARVEVRSLIASAQETERILSGIDENGSSLILSEPQKKTLNTDLAFLQNKLEYYNELSRDFNVERTKLLEDINSRIVQPTADDFYDDDFDDSSFEAVGNILDDAREAFLNIQQELDRAKDWMQHLLTDLKDNSIVLDNSEIKNSIGVAQSNIQEIIDKYNVFIQDTDDALRYIDDDSKNARMSRDGLEDLISSAENNREQANNALSRFASMMAYFMGRKKNQEPVAPVIDAVVNGEEQVATAVKSANKEIEGQIDLFNQAERASSKASDVAKDTGTKQRKKALTKSQSQQLQVIESGASGMLDAKKQNKITDEEIRDTGSKLSNALDEFEKSLGDTISKSTAKRIDSIRKTLGEAIGDAINGQPVAAEQKLSDITSDTNKQIKEQAELLHDVGNEAEAAAQAAESPRRTRSRTRTRRPAVVNDLFDEQTKETPSTQSVAVDQETEKKNNVLLTEQKKLLNEITVAKDKLRVLDQKAQPKTAEKLQAQVDEAEQQLKTVTIQILRSGSAKAVQSVLDNLQLDRFASEQLARKTDTASVIKEESSNLSELGRSAADAEKQINALAGLYSDLVSKAQANNISADAFDEVTYQISDLIDLYSSLNQAMSGNGEDPNALLNRLQFGIDGVKTTLDSYDVSLKTAIKDAKDNLAELNSNLSTAENSHARLETAAQNLIGSYQKLGLSDGILQPLIDQIATLDDLTQKYAAAIQGNDKESQVALWAQIKDAIVESDNSLAIFTDRFKDAQVAARNTQTAVRTIQSLTSQIDKKAGVAAAFGISREDLAPYNQMKSDLAAIVDQVRQYQQAWKSGDIALAAQLWKQIEESVAGIQESLKTNVGYTQAQSDLYDKINKAAVAAYKAQASAGYYTDPTTGERTEANRQDTQYQIGLREYANKLYQEYIALLKQAGTDEQTWAANSTQAKNALAEAQRKVNLEIAKQRDEEARLAGDASGEAVISLQLKLQSFLEKNTRLTANQRAELQNLLDTLTNKTSAVSNGELLKLQQRFESITLEAESLGTTGLSAINKIGNAYQKFGGWQLVTRSLSYVRQLIMQMPKNVQALESSLAEFSIVTGASGDRLERLGNQALSTAEKIKVSTSDILNAATVYARLGFSDTDSMEYARLTTMFAKVGGVEIADAENAITAMIKSFDVGTDQLESALDKLVAVGNNAPISAAQLGRLLPNRTVMYGTALAQNGETPEEDNPVGKTCICPCNDHSIIVIWCVCQPHFMGERMV